MVSHSFVVRSLLPFVRLFFTTFLILACLLPTALPTVLYAQDVSISHHLGEVCFAVADERRVGQGQPDSPADTLTMLDPNTGNTEVIGDTGTDNIEAMTFGPELEIYAADGGQLGILDPDTGAFTPRPQPFGVAGGSIGEFMIGDVDGLAFSLDQNILFGVQRRFDGSPAGPRPDFLFAINPTTGAHIPNYFGPNIDYVLIPAILDDDNNTLADVDDIQFDPVTGALYGVMNTDGRSGVLVTINVATGVPTPIATFRYADTGEIIDDIEGISFSNDGTLYGSSGDNYIDDPDDLNTLFEINTLTGQGVVIGPFPTTPNDYEALACLSSEAAIVLRKYTNGPGQAPDDADLPTGPEIPVGAPVTWTYIFTNTGILTLTNLSLIDDQIGSIGPAPTCIPTGTLLGPGQSLTCTATGVAEPGQYANIATVTGDSEPHPLYPVQTVSDTNPSHYFGLLPGISIIKFTNGEDADTPTGPQVSVGGTVTWTYEVRNTGTVPLSDVAVTDNIAGVTPVYASGDTNGNDLLDLNEVWLFVATGVAVEGQYANIGTVTGTPPNGPVVTDTNPSHYFGILPGIDIVKFTNGEDADTPTGPNIQVGDPVTWTYEVRNTGEVPLSNVTVTDNIAGVTPVYVSGDSNGNDLLDLDEIWLFQATGIAVEGQYANIGSVVGTPPVGPNVTDTNPSHYFGILQLAALGDRVWNDENENGLQDDGEPGVPNVTVNLLAGDCSTPMNQTDVTDENGIYGFTNLTPGSYCVEFVVNTLPTGYSFTQKDAGDNSKDSDADPSNGKTTSVTLASGESNLTLDAGIMAPNQPSLAALGDTVWYDVDQDGIQDAGEAGVPGVKVDLYTEGGTFVATQNTDANGKYLFDNLIPGSYYVEFATVPGYSFTRYNVSSNSQDALDSDPPIAWLDVTIDDGGDPAVKGEALTYTFHYTNTDAALAATNVVISTTIPAGTTFNPATSNAGWNCPNNAAGTVCTLTLATLNSNASGAATFTVNVDENAPNLPLDIFTSVTQSTVARTQSVTLVDGEANLTLDAGIVVVGSSLTSPTPTDPTNLPEEEQPQQDRSLFLPSVQVE